ncbi:MAG: ATP-binding protein [Candidatus Sumerlaeota bacterium]|nr:ATP-binding protein [Candidatus Sumerlaeota bacterium]
MTNSPTTATPFKTDSDNRPRLYLFSARSRNLIEAFSGRLSQWYSAQSVASQIEELTTPAEMALTSSVVLADFGGDPVREFGESDLLTIGRIQARLPQAVLALITPPTSPRMRQLIQRSGVRHVYSEPIDWEVVAAHLREIAARLTEREGASQRDLSTLMEICLAMGSMLELDPLLEKILDLMIADLMAHQASILLFDRDTDRLQMLAARGLPEEITKKGYIPRKGSIAEWVIDNDQPLLLHERVDDTRFSAIGDRHALVSSMCIPLRARGMVQGTINLNRLTPAPRFRQQDLRTATILAAQAAISIENARLYEANLQAARLATVGQTVAGVAHSMKSIVTSLRGGISICEKAREMRDWDLTDKGWGLVKRNFQRLSAMALDMLDYSKREREPVRSRFEIEPVIVEAINTVASRAQTKNAVLAHSVTPKGLLLSADPEQIFRALLNLVENAVDALDNEGRVEVRARQVAANSGEMIPISLDDSQGALFIDIEDTGSGIAPEDLDKVFAPFYSTKGSKGTGLGLAVTNKTFQEHGGRMLVESTVGKGTKFTVVLPN